MSITWIVVANSATARIFQIEKTGNATEVETLVHAQSRLHGRDLTSDRPGRTHESVGHTRHAMEPDTLPKEVEFALFAKLVAEYLHEAQKQGKFQKLYLSAGPHFLGLLRQEILPVVSETIQSEIDKDLTHMTASEVKNSFLTLK
ncbi:MAG: host attachment protein [Parachlamydiaceae bacterium]|nr:host attachment protein [Parachlamydiaceae bacterium]